METIMSPQTCRGPLHWAWRENRDELFERTGKPTASAPEVHAMLKEALAATNHLTFWRQLSDGQQQAALDFAFPPGTYSGSADEDRQDAIERMQSYVDRFDGLSRLVEKPLDRAQRETARDILKDLKEDLKTEVKYLDRYTDRTTDIEKQYVLPALFKADANLSARINTDPHSWHANLSWCRGDISHLLHDLKNPKT